MDSSGTSPISVEGSLNQIQGKLRALNVLVQERMAERSSYMELLQEISVAANETATVDAILQFTVYRVCVYTGWPVGHVYLAERNGSDQLVPADIWHLDNPRQFQTFRRITDVTTFSYGIGLPGKVLALGQPAWIADVTQDPEFLRARSDENINVKAAFAFPVTIGAEVAAVLEFFSPEAIEPDESLLEVMAVVGSQLGRVVERKRLEERMRSLNQELEERVIERTGQLKASNRSLKKEVAERKRAEETLKIRAAQQLVVAQLGQRALREPDVIRLMAEIAGQVVETLGVDYSKVLELLPSEDMFQVRAGAGWPEGIVGQALVEAGQQSQAGYTLLSDQAVIVTDLKKETRFKGMPLLHDHGVVSGMTVVISGRERPYGILGAHTTRLTTFTVDDANFLQAVANVLAAALERSQTEKALRLSRDQLEDRVRERTAELQAANFQLQEEVAERKRAEALIRQREQQLAEAQEIAHLGSWEWDITANELAWSDEMYRIYGLTPQAFEASFESFLDYVHPDDRSRVREIIERAYDTPQSFDFEHRIIRPDGEIRVLHGRGKVETTNEGQPVKMFGTGQDITERQQAETAIRHSEARFRSVFEGAGIGMATINRYKRILESNPVLQKLLDYSRSELSQMTFTDFIHPADIELNDTLYRELVSQNRQRYQLELRYLDQRDQQGWGRLTVSPLQSEENSPQFAVIMLEEITEQKEREVEVAELRRRLMEGREMERLILAQELHDGPLQDLNTVSLRMGELEPAVSDNEAGLSRMAAAQATLQKVMQTVRAICGELRPPALAPFGLEKAIRSDAENFQGRHPAIELELHLTADDQILPEQTRLALFRIYQQAMTNIDQHAQAQRIIIRFALDPDQIFLAIEDDGQGFVLPQRYIDLVRKGHYGLVGAIERAEAIGGSLKILTAPQEGTKVQVTVPRAPQQDPERSKLERTQS